MKAPSLHLVAHPGSSQPGSFRPMSSSSRLRLVPDVPIAPAKQLVLPGLPLRKETVVSVGMYDLRYDDFLKLLPAYGIRRILDTRFVWNFGHRGFPDLREFEQEMAALHIVYERADSPILDRPGPDGVLRPERTDNEVWSIVNRAFPLGRANLSDEVQLARYAEKLLREQVGLDLLRSRIVQGPLLLFGDSEPVPKRTEQDVLLDTFRVAFPNFAFDLVVYPRDKQRFPCEDRGEKPVAR